AARRLLVVADGGAASRPVPLDGRVCVVVATIAARSPGAGSDGADRPLRLRPGVRAGRESLERTAATAGERRQAEFAASDRRTTGPQAGIDARPGKCDRG